MLLDSTAEDVAESTIGDEFAETAAIINVKKL